MAPEASQRSASSEEPRILDRPMEQSEQSDIRLRYKLVASTYETLCKIKRQPERRDVLQTASLATEFQVFPIKAAEKNFLRTVNDHTSIPYRLTEPILEPWHKVFLLVQIDLSREPWPAKLTQTARKELYGERGRIYSALDKVIRCVADILGSRDDGRGVSVTLDVLRSVNAGVWEGNGMELLQVDGVGHAKLKRLGEAGVHTIRKLSGMEFYHIERLLSRNPPFGQTLLRQIAGFPLLCLSAEVLGQYEADHGARQTTKDMASSSRGGLWIVRATLAYGNIEVPIWNKKTPWITLVMEGENGALLWFWRGTAKKLSGSKQLVVALSVKLGDKVKATLACEAIVGTLTQTTFTI